MEEVERAKLILSQLGQFAHAPKKYTQLYRNYLLTECVRERADEKEYGPFRDSYTWILAPKDHPSTQREITHLLEHLKPEYRYKVEALAGISLEDFVKVLIEEEGMSEDFRRVFVEFGKRYLHRI